VGLTREVGANCREEDFGHSLARRNLDRFERDKNGAKKHTTSFEREKREKLFTGGVGGIEGGREKKTKEQGTTTTAKKKNNNKKEEEQERRRAKKKDKKGEGEGGPVA
jgi:hypothetical protein